MELMGRRNGRRGGNNYQVCINVTELLYHALGKQAARYGMRRSEFLRALLENIDDDPKAIERIMGPTEYEVVDYLDTKKPAAKAG